MNRKIRKEINRLGYPNTTTKLPLSVCSSKLLLLMAIRNERIYKKQKQEETYATNR